MTANEMRNLFKELYDGASAQEMGYDDIEVSRFLNLAQDIILKDKFFTTRNSQLEGFEDSSLRDVELSKLKMSATLWQDVNTNEWLFRYYNDAFINGKFQETTENVNLTYETIINFPAVIFTIPEYILFIVNDNGDIKLNNKLYRNVEIKAVNENELNDKLRNPFEKPDITVLYRSFETIHPITSQNDNIRLVKLYLPEDSEFYRWNVTFIKQPRRIVVDILNPNNQINCELHEIIHNDIVFKAVELALSSIGSLKTQTAIYNTNKNVN